MPKSKHLGGRAVIAVAGKRIEMTFSAGGKQARLSLPTDEARDLANGILTACSIIEKRAMN